MLSEEIGVLFNPNDPANRLYPPQRVLDDVLALLNDEDLAWPRSGRRTRRSAGCTSISRRRNCGIRPARRASPRNSYELAFRNQFFTPRYVVEFLTDNTLGRIWYEMRKGDTKLKDQCRYMVRRPTEIFLTEGQNRPQGRRREHGRSVARGTAQAAGLHPAPPEERPTGTEDPRSGLRQRPLPAVLLRPAAQRSTRKPTPIPTSARLQKDYPTLDDSAEGHVPGLILADNLHGIDIDLRATRLPPLPLWLRCQRAYQEMGLKKDRPKITRSNFVCAEPMPGEKPLLDEFLKTLREDRLEALIRRVMQVPEGTRVRATGSMADSLCILVRLVWDKMQLAGEAGSLLKIEEELQEAIRRGQEDGRKSNLSSESPSSA